MPKNRNCQNIEIHPHQPFLIHLFSFLILPGVIFALEEPQSQNQDEAIAGEKTAIPVKALLPIYATAFIGMLVFFVFPIQVPFHLASIGEISNSQVGLALSLQTFSSVIIALLYHRLKARYSFYAIFALVFMVLGINHFILAWTESYNLGVIGLMIGGLGVGLMPPNNSVWLASVTPPAVRGRAVGGLTGLLFLGSFFTPFVTQPLETQFGMSGMFMTFGIASVILTLVFIGFAVKSSANS